MKQLEDKKVVLLDRQLGVYIIPQRFAIDHYDADKRWVGADKSDIEILKAGPEPDPERPEYWEAWERVVDHARYHDKDGREWELWQEDDLFAYTGDVDQWR